MTGNVRYHSSSSQCLATVKTKVNCSTWTDRLWFGCRETILWLPLIWMLRNLSMIVFDLNASEFIYDRLWFECRGTNLWLGLFWMPMNWSLDPHVTYTITGFSFFHLESDFDYFYELKKSFKLSYPYCIFYKFCFCRNWNLVVVLFFKSLNYFSFQIFRFTFPKKSGCLSPVFYAINIVKKTRFSLFSLTLRHGSSGCSLCSEKKPA